MDVLWTIEASAKFMGEVEEMKHTNIEEKIPTSKGK